MQTPFPSSLRRQPCICSHHSAANRQLRGPKTSIWTTCFNSSLLQCRWCTPAALPTAVSPRRSAPARPPQRPALPEPTHACRLPSSSRSTFGFGASRRTALLRAQVRARALPCARRRRHRATVPAGNDASPWNIRAGTPFNFALSGAFPPEVRWIVIYLLMFPSPKPVTACL